MKTDNVDDEWKKTFEEDFSSLEPGDFIEVNYVVITVMRTMVDEYGRKWLRITCDCKKNYLHLRQGWFTYSCGVDSQYFLTNDEGVEDEEPIKSFYISHGDGLSELAEFGNLIWTEDLTSIPDNDEVFPKDLNYTANETDIVARVAESIKAGTLPEDDIFTLLVTLDLVGCNLTQEQKIKIMRISTFLETAFDEIMSVDAEVEGEAQNILH